MIQIYVRKSSVGNDNKAYNKDKLEKLKAEVIAILEKKDKQDFKKAIEYFEQDEKRYSHLEKSLDGKWIEKAGYGVGTVRIWKGKKYKKVSSSPVRWVRVFDKNDRGAATSMGKYIAQVKACKTAEDLYNFCLKQRSLFQDDNGVDLPIMDKLRAAIDEQKGKVGDELDGSKHFQYKDKENKTTEKKESESKTIDITPNDAVYIINNLTTPKGIQNAIDVLQHEIDMNNMPERFIEKNKAEIKTLEYTSNLLNKIIDKNNLSDGEKESLLNELKDLTKKVNKADSSKSKTAAKDRLKNMLTNIKKDFESESEKHQNRSDAMKGNKNAYKGGPKDEPKETEDAQKDKGAEKTNSISSIREKYENSKSVTGNKKTLYVGNEKVKGHWKLVEAETPTASHDETTYGKTPGFPTSKDGGTINDRDYEHDKDAQESVRSIAANYNGRALDMGEPVIVTKDGIVVSGNNRTMSSKLAAKNGTDKQYIEDLKDQIDEFGIDEDELSGFKHPRIVFELDEEHNGDYTTEEFAKYNKTGKKSKNTTEKAVEISKTIKPETIQALADKISEFDTLGEMYNNNKAASEFVNSLVSNGVIQQNDVSQYYTESGGLSENGKEFIETALVGGIMNENNIRSLAGAGGKAVRQKLVRAIVPLIDNKGIGKEYTFNDELNKAVSIVVEVMKNRDKFPTIQDFLKQGNMFEEEPDKLTATLATMIHDNTQKEFAEKMREVEGGLRPSANGQFDMFLAECESRDSILSRILKYTEKVKKSIDEFLEFLKR